MLIVIYIARLLAANFHICNNITVPNNMYCYGDPATNYTTHKIDCLRNCSLDCLEDQNTEPVCASDLGTYHGSCDMKIKTCELYARKYLEEGNVTMAEKMIGNITVTDNQACPRE